MSVTELRRESGETYAEGLARAARIEAETDALRAKTESDRRRQALVDEKAAAKAQADIEASLAEAADEKRRRDEARRESAEAKARAAKSAETWKKAAKSIAAVCVLVSLPLQIMAFWDPHAWFLVAAPFVLEGVAWALLTGAQAAIDDGRPSWHYRLGALIQALIAAGINYAHGSETYGIATGIGGALCSVIGPMIWDLHEHGRIAKREGHIPRSVRRAEARAAKREAKRIDAVNEARAVRDKDVWERALDLAAALAEQTPSESTYRRAWTEIHGAEVGQTAERIAHTRAAKRAVRLAQNGPLEKPEKDAIAQVDSQLTSEDGKSAKGPKQPGEDGRKRNGGTPPRRRPGTTLYSSAARSQMRATARARTTAETSA
ncbi:hypothetical protein SLUN_19435 [Streptomyces lunaelactis]|uniref:DUF2637 domain-containing protein n=1 Tax=Streptomyces lunaelactis TaxID=1535768 RepID=A0A2R4T4D2_9ACTN|nr:hypothetical protein [Streptomyces lunaelactis]AVZ74010.1 hypothetical protein SLUN_19435 [Streptomyces lunaelactis]NUK85184.1 hypothetical protein [Streptomyces lunaelactis]